jgi:DNA-directed RNA polymerase specialized sigma24 family protein
MERIPDPQQMDLEALFEAEWREGLCAEGMERLKRKFTLRQFQLFDLLVFKEWKAEDVASSLGMSVANVYVTRHRMTAALKKQIRRLEKEFQKMAEKRASKATRDRL